MKPKDPTYKVRLFNDGIDVPVASYEGCTSHRVNSDGQLEFIRRTGQKTVTNMRYEVTVE